MNMAVFYYRPRNREEKAKEKNLNKAMICVAVYIYCSWHCLVFSFFFSCCKPNINAGLNHLDLL